MATMKEPKYFKTNGESYTLLSIYYTLTMDYHDIVVKAIKKRAQLLVENPTQSHPLDKALNSLKTINISRQTQTTTRPATPQQRHQHNPAQLQDDRIEISTAVTESVTTRTDTKQHSHQLHKSKSGKRSVFDRLGPTDPQKEDYLAKLHYNPKRIRQF